MKNKNFFCIHSIILSSLLLCLFSCNYSSNKSTIELEKEILSKKPKCWLTVDTFSYKGIRIGDNIHSIWQKYNLKKKSENIYEVKNLENLTIFKYNISELTINTFEDTIYRINITINKPLFFLNDILYRLGNRYNLSSCIVSFNEKTTIGSTISELVMLNNKIEIKAIISKLLFSKGETKLVNNMIEVRKIQNEGNFYVGDIIFDYRGFAYKIDDINLLKKVFHNNGGVNTKKGRITLYKRRFSLNISVLDLIKNQKIKKRENKFKENKLKEIQNENEVIIKDDF